MKGSCLLDETGGEEHQGQVEANIDPSCLSLYVFILGDGTGHTIIYRPRSRYKVLRPEGICYPTDRSRVLAMYPSILTSRRLVNGLSQ